MVTRDVRPQATTGGSTLLVDWLGRGGIAQTTAAWSAALLAAGQPCTTVSWAGSELAGSVAPFVGVRRTTSRLVGHRRLAGAVATLLDGGEFRTVLVQNYIVPTLELVAWRAAARNGVRVVFAVHNHRPHEWRSGTSLGMSHLVDRADALVFYSHYVAERTIRGAASSRSTVLPLPPPPGSLTAVVPVPAWMDGDGPPWAVHFGVVGRRYKGARTVREVASVPKGWRLAAIGNGAAALPVTKVLSGYVPDHELWGSIAGARAALLPYTRATQSAAVVLAQALGAVPVTAAAGGILEQVTDGVDGFLVAPGAPVRSWVERLDELRDERRRASMSEAAHLAAREADAAFRASGPPVVA